MSKQYQVKQIETNKRGFKVTRTVSTEDAEEIKALLGLENKTSSNSKKATKSTKEATLKNKKGVVIDAEFSEVKSKKKKTTTKPKALSAPKDVKAKESKPKKESKKKDSKPKSTTSKTALKTYSYYIEELDSGVVVYAPDKAGADKVINYFCKRTGKHARFNFIVKSTKENQKLIDKHKLTADNYYHVQIEALEKGIKKNTPTAKKQEVKALPEANPKLSALRLNVRINNTCLELMKKNPKIKYYGSSRNENDYTFMYYGDIYHFKSLPEAVKAFMNYKVWYEAGEVKTKKLSGQPSIKPKPKHPATKLKKINSFGNSNKYEFYNKKGERVLIEISKTTTNPKDKNCLPNRWVKAGYLKKPIYNYLNVDTYVYDEDGNCYGGYNPTVNGDKINFDWLLEATSVNEKKILNEVYRLANL